MIRLSALWFVVFFVGIYTWKDWFRGLCGVVLLLGILEYPDVPRSMFGVPGLNFFNLLLLNVVIAWLVQRRHERLTWDLPRHISLLLAVYLAVVLNGWLRMVRDPAYMDMTTTTMVSEYLINTLKWTIPGLLLFDGCRSRQRLREATFACLGALVFLGFMTIKVMPLSAPLMSGDELQRLAVKLTQTRIGYHRVTLSMMLAGVSWALIAARPLLPDARLRLLCIVTSGFMLYAMSLTGGRAGYVTWAAIGLIVGVLRWRKVLLAVPVVVALVVYFMPGVVDRMMNGIGAGGSTTVSVDTYEASAGRVIMWPYVIEEIKKNPLLGHGREAMRRSGIVSFLYNFLGEEFGHPHNAYLEFVLDNGVIGFAPVLIFFLVILFHSFRLFLDSRSMLFVAAGGVSCALVLALMVAGMTSQSFYPIEGTVEMWCAMGLMLRLSVERKRVLATAAAPGIIGSFATKWRQPAHVSQAPDIASLVLPERPVAPPPAPRAPWQPPKIAPTFEPRFAASASAPRPAARQDRRPIPTRTAHYDFS